MTPDKIPLPRKLKGLMLRLPFMITCEEFEGFIIAYFEDDLSRGQRMIFDVHLKVCKECREYLRPIAHQWIYQRVRCRIEPRRH